MRKLLISTAILMMSATGAFAATTETITGTYSVAYTPSVGNGPSINNPGQVAADNIHPLASSFSETLTAGTTYGQTDFFAVTPAGSCGSGCDTNYHHSDYDTASGTLTVTFTFDNSNLPGNQSTQSNYVSTAHYIADYNGDTNSVTWTSTDPFTVNFNDGSMLTVNLINASDWTIVPDIKFYLNNGPTTTVPEPSSIALVGAGLLGLGFVVARNRRKILKKAV